MSDSAFSQATDDACAVSGRFRYLRWAAAGVVGAALVVALASAWLPAGDLLYRENGVLEDLSVICWVLSCTLAIGAAMRSTAFAGRLMARWTGWVAVLAGMRELDLQIWLNPQHLGALGVRYRLDWWMSGKVSVWLMLGWAAVFCAAAVVVIYPPLKFRRLLFRLLREGDAFTGLLVISVLFLALGFVMDDILRPVGLVTTATKNLIEETSEAIGAILYCASMVLQWRSPLGMRSRQAGLTAGRASQEARGSGTSERDSPSSDECP